MDKPPRTKPMQLHWRETTRQGKAERKIAVLKEIIKHERKLER